MAILLNPRPQQLTFHTAPVGPRARRCTRGALGKSPGACCQQHCTHLSKRAGTHARLAYARRPRVTAPPVGAQPPHASLNKQTAARGCGVACSPTSTVFFSGWPPLSTVSSRAPSGRAQQHAGLTVGACWQHVALPARRMRVGACEVVILLEPFGFGPPRWPARAAAALPLLSSPAALRLPPPPCAPRPLLYPIQPDAPHLGVPAHCCRRRKPIWSTCTPPHAACAHPRHHQNRHLATSLHTRAPAPLSTRPRAPVSIPPDPLLPHQVAAISALFLSRVPQPARARGCRAATKLLSPAVLPLLARPLPSTGHQAYAPHPTPPVVFFSRAGPF
jgi:hypothetical protein